MASETFDPYYKWLGIPKNQRPPNHYQILGLQVGEPDAEVIDEAAIRQTTHLRSYQLGPNAAECTRILTEIAQAKQVLLHPEKKRAYDQTLMVAAPPVSVGSAVEDRSRTANRRPLQDLPPEEEFDIEAAPRKSSTRSKKKRRSETMWTPPVLAAAGGAVAVVLLLIVVIVILANRPAVQPIVKNNIPVAPPVRPPVKPVEPPKELPKVVELPKQVDPPVAVPKGNFDASAANGFWQATDPNDRNFRYQLAFAHAPGKNPAMTFRLTYVKNGFVLGYAHDDNPVLDDGVVSFAWVNDKPPRAEMAARVPTKFRFENNQLVEARADVPELKYDRLITDYRTQMGKWRGQFDKGSVDITLHPAGGGYGGIMFLTPQGAPPLQTWINAIHPASNGLAWDLKFDRQDAMWGPYRRAQVLPNGADLSLELSTADQKTVRVPLAKVNN